ncbi:MAG TPA: ABC transporter permease subunit [Gemmataceae bacterium]|nr:ABC transporter permease subunit [Gemmataceae bacterium]
MPASNQEDAAVSLGRHLAIVCSPVLAALAALGEYRLLGDAVPVSQDAVYPAALGIVLTLAVFLAITSTLWRNFGNAWRYYAPLLAGALGVLVLWDLLTQKLAWLPPFYFPGPPRVLAAIVNDRAILFESTAHSLVLLLTGYGVGVVAGISSGVVIGWFPAVRYWSMPALKLIGPLPATALIPLVMMMSADSFIPAMVLIGFAVWFPVTMLTSAGIASVRLSHLDVARTLGAGRWYLIFHVALPSALPHIFLGLFMGLLASFLTLIVAEGVGVTAGLGHYLRTQKEAMAYANFYGALLIIAIFCSTLLTILLRVRDRMLRWQIGVLKW